LVFFFSLRPPPPRPTLFPYTTLFRSPLTAVHAPVPVGRRRSLGSAAPVSPPVRAAVRHRRVLGAAPARTSRAHRAVGVARRRRGGRLARPRTDAFRPGRHFRRARRPGTGLQLQGAGRHRRAGASAGPVAGPPASNLTVLGLIAETERAAATSSTDGRPAVAYGVGMQIRGNHTLKAVSAREVVILPVGVEICVDAPALT